jgi:hypothetical protein
MKGLAKRLTKLPGRDNLGRVNRQASVCLRGGHAQ